VETREKPSEVPLWGACSLFSQIPTLLLPVIIKPLHHHCLPHAPCPRGNALDRVKALAPHHPEWKTTDPFASLLTGDLKTALAGGDRTLLELVMATHTGMTTGEFEQIVKDWIATAKHPKTGKLYTDMVYQPMLEVLAYVRTNGFKTFIVSGGGIELMRPWAEQVYGIPPQQVIGSRVVYLERADN
jgi:hypothetical protein